MLENLMADPGTGQTLSGEFGINELTELQKSLTAGYGSDVAQLTGGGALRIQSLDTVLKATVQNNKHFTLYNLLQKPEATATVDEWTEQYSVGGFLGGSTNTEDGDADETQGDYARRVGLVKYLACYRKVPIVLGAQNNIVDAKAKESMNGSVQLLTDIEYLCFEGDDSVVPTEFPGLNKQLIDLGSSDHVIDNLGQPLNSVSKISLGAQVIGTIDNFGTPTNIIVPPAVQTDLNNGLDPAFRVALNGNPQSTVIGTPVTGINTQWGEIATNQDLFIRDEVKKVPFELLYPAIAARNSAFVPGGLTATAASNANSLFQTAHAGNFYYYVVGVNNKGQSTGVLSSQIAVSAGQAVTLTITKSASDLETGYVIYRSRKNGTNALTDLREMVRIPQAGNTTVYVDLNYDMPGTTKAYILNLNPGDDAISWKQFLPMMKIPMAAVKSPIIPWIQMICGYLRITKRKQHVLIKNIVPSGALWKPFG